MPGNLLKTLEKSWKYHGILSVQKSGNPVIMCHSQDAINNISDTTVRRGIVIQQLLQHVGGMCLHQLHNDLLHTPLGSFILQQHPVDVTYLERVCDILDNAVHVDDRQTITCALIIFQVCHLKTSSFVLQVYCTQWTFTTYIILFSL